ncbi:MAG: TonB-dependent receptor plug domain-containing protein [Cyclobacteriaceae bacterium]
MPFPRCRRVLLFLVVVIQVTPLLSQERQVLFSDFVKEMTETYNTGFTYNQGLLDGLVVLLPENCNNLVDCLEAVTRINPLQFEKADGNQYLILPVRSTANFIVTDSETGETVNAIRVVVNGLPEQYLLPRESQYSISNLFPTDSILIRSRFYSPRKTVASSLLNESISFVLSPDTIYLQEVVIEDYLSSGVDSKLSDHSMQIDMRSLGLLAGETDGDILNVLKRLPGIRTPDGKPGSLNFRGSTFDHTLIYFDEIPIYHSGHFFGTISPYNPSAVSRIKVFRGVLPAKFGGRVGGLIDLQTENNVVDSAQYSATANTISAGMRMSAPIKRNKIGISLAARSNYPIDYLAPKLEAFRTLNFQGSKVDPNIPNDRKVIDQFDVRFQDFNGKLIFIPNENHRAALSFMNIQNHFVYNFDSRDLNQVEHQVSDLDNLGMTAKWDATLLENLNMDVGITTSSLNIFESNSESTQSTPSRYDDISNTIKDLRLNSGLKYRVSDRSTIEVGYQLINHKVTLDEQGGLNQPRTNRKEKAQIHSFHINSQDSWGTRLITSFGIHYDYYTPLDKQYIDPRLTISFMATESLYLKASGGRAHQFIKRKLSNDFDDFRLQNQFWSLANDRSPVLEGVQGMIGFMYDQSSWLVDLELYVKRTSGITRQESPTMVMDGSLLTKGLDLFIKRRWAQFETWASYSLSHVETDFRRTLTAYYNQKHIFNLTAIHRFGRWNFAASWGYLSGMPVLIPELDPSEPNSNGQTTLSVPYSDNFPSQHQLDLSVTYGFIKRVNHWQGVIGLSLLNVYDRKNIINIFQNAPRVEQPFRYAVGFAPNISVSINF